MDVGAEYVCGGVWGVLEVRWGGEGGGGAEGEGGALVCLGG